VPSFVQLIAASPDGETYYRGRVPEQEANGDGGGAPAAAAANLTRQGAAVTFDVPPGRLQLRLSVGANAGAIDSDDREIVVPDLTAAETIFGTPRVYVARNALELRALSNNPNAQPTAGRDFRRTDRLIIRTDAYGRQRGAQGDIEAVEQAGAATRRHPGHCSGKRGRAVPGRSAPGLPRPRRVPARADRDDRRTAADDRTDPLQGRGLSDMFEVAMVEVAMSCGDV
jgi:hypothetical protein